MREKEEDAKPFWAHFIDEKEAARLSHYAVEKTYLECDLTEAEQKKIETLLEETQFIISPMLDKAFQDVCSFLSWYILKDEEER